jgi:methionyl aminopeptidase
MMVPIKTSDELNIMWEANQIVGTVLSELKALVEPGISTLELDDFAERKIMENDALPAFKGFRGYPNTLCASVNSGIVHGIPSKRQLKAGDIVSLDVGVIHRGYYGDSAVTCAVGEITPLAQRLMDVTRTALYKAIDKALAGNKIWDISKAIQEYVEENGFSVVRDLVGHGIGKNLHEEPKIPNYVMSQSDRAQSLTLEDGMVLAIEPMVNEKGWQLRFLEDSWTTVTKDGGLSAHFEHTVAISKNGPWILSEVPPGANRMDKHENVQMKGI